MPYLESVFKEQRGLGLGATQLVGEISRDDPILMQKGYSDFKDKVDVIESTPITSFLKSTHLHYLSVFMEYKEEPIVDNQIAVVTELTQKDNTNTIHLFNSDEERVELSVIVNQVAEDIEGQLADKKKRHVLAETPPTLTYVIELLNVMATATKGKNAITEVMCQSLLPASEFIKCFEEAKFMYNYKIALLQYFIDAYLDIDKDVPTALQDDIWNFVGLLNQELDIFLTKTSDQAIFNAFTKGRGDDKSSSASAPSIFIIGLFGKYNLKKLVEEFVYETVLSSLDKIFQLRLVVKKDRGKKSYLEKYS